MAEIPTFLIDGQDVPMDRMRRYLTRLSGQAESALLNSIDGAAPFATLALAQAAPSVGAGSQARVFNDPDPTKNGLYVNATGASGGYALDEQFYAALSRVVQPVVDEAEAARDEAEAIVQSLKTPAMAVFGNDVVIDGEPSSNLTMITGQAAEADATLTRLRIFVPTARNAKLTSFPVTGSGPFAAGLHGPTITVALQAGANDIAINLAVPKGNHPALYAGTGIAAIGGDTSNPIFYSFGDATAATGPFAVTPFAASNVQFGFTYSYEALALARLQIAASEAEAQSLSIANPDVIYLVAP